MAPSSRKPTTLRTVGLRSLLIAAVALPIFSVVIVLEHKTISYNLPVIVAFTVGMGLFAFVSLSVMDDSPARDDFLSFLAESFPWLPTLIGLVSIPFWYWYAPRLGAIDGAFFEVSAQVIPVLLLAIMIDVRQSKELRSFELVGTILGLLLGEIVTLQGAARSRGGRVDYALVCGVLVLGFCALIIAVIAEFQRRDSA